MNCFEKVMPFDKYSGSENEGDYYKDGLRYCGKCHKKKQTRVRWGGRERVVNCVCLCDEEAEMKAKARAEEINRIDAIKRNRRLGFPDDELVKCTFDKDDGKSPHIMRVAENYVKNFEEAKADGKGLLLLGETETGKSFAAACIVNALIDKGYCCQMTNISMLINRIWDKGNKAQSVLDNLKYYDLLVIDDLGVEHNSEYVMSQQQQIIDARYRSGKPIIVTTNLTATQLKNPKNIVEDRLFSRLYEMCIPYEVAGIKRRQEKLKESFQKYKTLLDI